jgi:hypothetical protein
MGVSGQRHAPAALLPPGKGPPVPIVQKVGWAPEPVWTQRLEEKILCPCRGSNPERPVVQPVVRHCTATSFNPAEPMFKQTQLEDNNVRLAVTWLRRLVAGFSSRRPGSVHVRFEMDRVALEQNFLRFLQFITVSIIPPSLSTVTLSSGDKQQAHWRLQLGNPSGMNTKDARVE